MPDRSKPRAPALYGVIAIKLTKGLIFLSVALIAYCLSDNDLPADYQKVLHVLRLNPEKQFFAYLAEKIGDITQANVLWVAAGTLVYSLFSLVEGIGLIFRVSWASWMAIGESAFFIPIEIHDLLKRGFTWVVTVILILNLFIFWYLLLNRKRLFHRAHLHRAPRSGAPAGPSRTESSAPGALQAAGPQPASERGAPEPGT